MRATFQAINLNPQQNNVEVRTETPHSCPRCKIAFADLPKITYCIDLNSSYKQGAFAYSLYFCPNCGKCFLIEYKILDDFRIHGPLDAHPIAVYPQPNTEKDFSEEIAKLSPNFIKIYHQAEKAENTGLSEICGLGYRKALEFLVKDYGIAFYPNDEEKIKKLTLSACINTYIDNHRIKALATASAWLGNDETHYVRKHETYNLAHLKAFISATVSFIDSELSYWKAEELLRAPK
jgi:hypothetical protein